MIAQFSWEPGLDSPWPVCRVVSQDQGDISPVACLLMDTGGLPLESSIEWVDEGIRRLAKVLSGSSRSSDWDGEDWGASFDALETRAYSLHEESCFEVVPTPAFQRLLAAWREFLSADPNNVQLTEINVQINVR